MGMIKFAGQQYSKVFFSALSIGLYSERKEFAVGCVFVGEGGWADLAFR